MPLCAFLYSFIWEITFLDPFFNMNRWINLLLCTCILHWALDHFFFEDELVDHFFALYFFAFV